MYKEFCAIHCERKRFIHAIDLLILYNTRYWGNNLNVIKQISPLGGFNVSVL